MQLQQRAIKSNQSLFRRVALYPLTAGLAFGVGHFLIYWILRQSIFQQFKKWFYSLVE